MKTYKTKDIPEKWTQTRQSCIDLNPDLEFRLWTDESSREFIRTEFGQGALENYDSYPYDIQRVDAFRYYLLYNQGGIYMDLDIGCRKSLQSLRQYAAILPRTDPFGISNDFMVSRQGHPFFKRIIDQLPEYNYKYLLGTKYPTVMFSTGPAFVDIQLMQYYKQNPTAHDQHRKIDNQMLAESNGSLVGILSSIEYGNNRDHSYLYHVQGSSWHSTDAKFVFWLGRNLKTVLVGLILTPLVLAIAVLVVKRRRREQYLPLYNLNYNSNKRSDMKR